MINSHYNEEMLGINDWGLKKTAQIWYNSDLSRYTLRK